MPIVPDAPDEEPRDLALAACDLSPLALRLGQHVVVPVLRRQPRQRAGAQRGADRRPCARCVEADDADEMAKVGAIERGVVERDREQALDTVRCVRERQRPGGGGAAVERDRLPGIALPQRHIEGDEQRPIADVVLLDGGACRCARRPRDYVARDDVACEDVACD